MNGLAFISGLLAQDNPPLSPVDRFHAMQRWQESTYDLTPFWIGLIALLCLVVAALIVGIIRVRRASAREARENFRLHADHAGLTRGERTLLQQVATLASLRRADAVFSLEDSFAVGARRYLQSPSYTGLAGDDRKQAETILEALSQKLGFSSPLPPPPAAGPSTREILTSGSITVLHPETGEEFAAAIDRVVPEALIVSPASDAKVKVGQAVTARYSNHGCLWEFETDVIGLDGPRIWLRHTDEARSINRRRFPRVRTARRALVAELPFVQVGVEMAPPRFAHDAVVEIGGPGMVVNAGPNVAADDKMLLVVSFPDGRVVQGLAKVRRVIPDGDRTPSVALEFTDLTAAHLTELMRQTNLALHEHGQTPEEHAEPSGQGDPAAAPPAGPAPAQANDAAPAWRESSDSAKTPHVEPNGASGAQETVDHGH